MSDAVVLPAPQHNGIGGDGPMLAAVGGALNAIAVVIVCLRGYAASHTGGKWRWDFIWVALGTAFGIVASSSFFNAVSYGLGNDLANLTYSQIFGTLHWIWITIFTGLVATTFAKYSMISLMLQVQGPNAKKRRWALWAIAVVFTLVNFLQIVLIVTQCDPTERLWNRYLDGTCSRGWIASDWSYLQGAVGAFTDFTLALWPIGIAWNLQTSRRVKVMFCTLMGIGMLPAAACFVRVVKLPAVSTSTNITRDFTQFMLWCVIEFWSIIILTSIPVLRPLFLRVFYGIKSSAVRSTQQPRSTTRGGVRSTHDGRSKVATQITARNVSILDPEKDDSEEEVVGKDNFSMNIIVNKTFDVQEHPSEEV